MSIAIISDICIRPYLVSFNPLCGDQHCCGLRQTSCRGPLPGLPLLYMLYPSCLQPLSFPTDAEVWDRPCLVLTHADLKVQNAVMLRGVNFRPRRRELVDKFILLYPYPTHSLYHGFLNKDSPDRIKASVEFNGTKLYQVSFRWLSFRLPLSPCLLCLLPDHASLIK